MHPVRTAHERPPQSIQPVSGGVGEASATPPRPAGGTGGAHRDVVLGHVHCRTGVLLVGELVEGRLVRERPEAVVGAVEEVGPEAPGGHGPTHIAQAAVLELLAVVVAVVAVVVVSRAECTVKRCTRKP